MSTVSVYVCLPLCENVPSPSLHIAIRNYLFCAERLLSLSHTLSPFFFFFLLLVHRTSVPIMNKMIHYSDLFFLISSNFRQCTLLCSTTVLSSVFVLAHTHTRTLEESKWMCSFHILVPLNCMEIITFLIKLLQKMFFINKIIRKLYKAVLFSLLERNGDHKINDHNTDAEYV